MSFRKTVAIVSLAGALSACGGIDSPSKNAIQDFSGTLPVGQSVVHPFSVSKNGEFFITITELSDRTLIVGTALGEALSTGCSPFGGFVQPYSRWNQQALGGPINKGNFCVLVYDSVGLSAPATYTVRVSHP